MRRIVYTTSAIDDIERLVQVLLDSDPEAAFSTTAIIKDGLDVLARHPLLGRPARGRMRELVISRGRAGYIATHEYDADLDRLIVHGIRHQREAGFEE